MKNSISEILKKEKIDEGKISDCFMRSFDLSSENMSDIDKFALEADNNLLA